LGAQPSLTHAQGSTAYPYKRIEIFVPFPSGGTADFLARLIAHKLSESWGQTVVINNKPGGTGRIGADLAAQSIPDGHTLLVTSYANRRILFEQAAPLKNPAKDLIPIAIIAMAPLVLVAHPSLPANSVSEFIAIARDQRQLLSYASIGNGTPSHLAMEMLMRMSDTRLTHVPYKGSSQAITDIIAGHLPVMFDSVVSSFEQVKAGKLKALAVSTASRLPIAPNVPTISESGLPGFDVFTWAVLYTPAGTHADRLEKLRLELARILKMPDVAERITAQGAIVPESMSLAQVATFVSEDVTTWRKLIKDSNILAE